MNIMKEDSEGQTIVFEDEIKVSSTNPKTTGGKSVIRVYKNHVKIAEEYVAKRSPLKYLNSLSRSKHFASLEGQLIAHGLTLIDIGVKRNVEC